MKTEGILQNQGKGILLILLSGLFWALSSTISKFLLNGGATPVLLIFSRNVFGTLCLALVIFATQKERFKVEKADRKKMVYCCILMFMYSACYFFSLSFINVSVAVLLLYLYPTLVSVVSVYFLKEKLRFIQIAALVFALVGLGFTVNLFTGEMDAAVNLPGLMLGIGAAVGAAGYCLAVKSLSDKYHTLPLISTA